MPLPPASCSAATRACTSDDEEEKELAVSAEEGRGAVAVGAEASDVVVVEEVGGGGIISPSRVSRVNGKMAPPPWTYRPQSSNSGPRRPGALCPSCTNSSSVTHAAIQDVDRHHSVSNAHAHAHYKECIEYQRLRTLCRAPTWVVGSRRWVVQRRRSDIDPCTKSSCAQFGVCLCKHAHKDDEETIRLCAHTQAQMYCCRVHTF
jgi:hypothetical protein